MGVKTVQIDLIGDRPPAPAIDSRWRDNKVSAFV